MTKLKNDQNPALWLSDAPLHTPFRALPLPPMGKLAKRACSPYRSRLAKRLLKKPIRFTFDTAFHVLKLGGKIAIGVQFADGIRTLHTDVRAFHHYNSWGLENGIYEPDVAALLGILLKGNVRFADIGANWGYFSVFAATLPEFTGKIDAIEPMPQTHADLKHAISELGLDNRITAHRIALSDTTGSVQMASDDALHTGIARVVEASASNANSVPCHPLDNSPLSAPDVIKMDVEEHEIHALRGATSVLGKTKPFLIMENWYATHDPAQSFAPLRFLREHDYALFRPVWFNEVSGPHGPGHLLSAIPPSSTPRTLALVGFDPESRPLMPNQITVFGCHKSRLSLLEDYGFRPGPG